MKAENQIKGACNKAHGDYAERLSINILKRLGLDKVEKIHVGYAISMIRGKVVGAKRISYTNCDLRASLLGMAAHCEVKYTTKDRLNYSDFIIIRKEHFGTTHLDHEIRWLQEAHDKHTLALVAWQCSTEVSPLLLPYIMPDGRPIVEKGRGISLEQAKAIALDRAGLLALRARQLALAQELL